VTWAFAYLAALVVGLVLAVVTGLLRDLRSLARHRLVVPHPDQSPPFISLLGRLSPGLILGGAVGLVLGGGRVPDPSRTLLVALAAGGACFLLANVVMRHRPPRRAPVEKAVVVREIAPRGYGQVRIEYGKKSVVMAAQSLETGLIAAGTVVDVVDCTRSVITIRLQTPE
jgi:hypothetical protein